MSQHLLEFERHFQFVRMNDFYTRAYRPRWERQIYALWYNLNMFKHILIISSMLFTLICGSCISASPIYTDEEFKSTEWETHVKEVNSHLDEYKKFIGINTEYFDDIDKISELENKHLKIGYEFIKTFCDDFNNSSCDLLLEDDEEEWSNRDFQLSYVSRIENIYFENHTIYRAEDRADHPAYNVVFAIENSASSPTLIFFEDGHLASPKENALSKEELNASFNSIIKAEPHLNITEEDLLSYVGFYLFLTSRNPGDFVINSLEDYKNYCEIVGFCEGIKDVVEKIKKGQKELPETMIKRVDHDDKHGWSITIKTISYCGFFDIRELTVFENGEIYLEEISRIYPLPYKNYCYTF